LFVTLTAAYKAKRSFAAAGNVAEKNATKAQSADWRFS
jgi:hypothetical protein